MVESRTARMRLVQWSSGTDSPQRVDFNETFLNIETLAAIDQQGTYNDRPAANKTGMYYFATDQGTLYRSDGTNWAVVGASVLSQLVRPARTDAVAQTVQGLASQTADLQRVIASTGTVYQRVRSNGDLIHGALRVSQAARTATATDTAPSDSAMTVDNNANGMWNLSLLNPSGNTTGFFRAVRGGTTVFSVGVDGTTTTPQVLLGSAPTAANHATTKTYVDTLVSSTVYTLTGSNISGVLPVSRGGTGRTSLGTGQYLIGAGTGAITGLSSAEVLTDIAAAPAGHGHALTDANITGTLPLNQGGTGATTQAAARTALGVPVDTTQMIAGTGLTGGGTLQANRTFSVVYGGNGSANSASRSDHYHATITLPSGIIAGLSDYGTGQFYFNNAAGDRVFTLNGDGKVQFFNNASSIAADGTTAGLKVPWGNVTGTPATYPPSTHGHDLTDANVTGVLSVAQGGTGSTTAPAARTALAAAGSATAINTGAGLTGGGNLTASRTLSVTFGGTGSATTVSRSDHTHTASAIVDRLTTAQLPLLGELPNAVDLNDYITDGEWSQTSSNEAAAGTNYPAGLAGKLRVAASSSGTMIWQSYITYAPSNPTMYLRVKYGSTWGAWRQIADKADIDALVSVYAPLVHGHALTDANITGVLPVVQGGTGATTVAAARTALGVPVATTTMTAGAGLSGGGDLSANRTFQVVFEGSGTKDTSARSDHGHALTDANVTGTLPVNQGGTGRTTLTSGYYLRGAGTSVVDLRTAAQVLADIGGAPAVHGHALTDSNITGTLPVAQGGTGLTTLAQDAYMTGNGTGVMTARTPANVLSHIGAAPAVHGHALTDANITGTLPLAQGGTGATTQAAARSALAVPSTSVTISAGAGLTGGGSLAANRTLNVSFAGTGSATTVARSDHNHQFSEILGSLGFSQMPDVVRLGSADDLNTYTTVGDYVQTANNGASGGTNYPSGEAGRLFVRTDHPGSTSMLWQIYISYAVSRPSVFIRSRYINTWGAWSRLLDDQDLTAVNANIATIERTQRRLYRHYPPSSFVLDTNTANTSWTSSIVGGLAITIPTWATHAVVRAGLYQGYTNIKSGTGSGAYWGQTRIALGPYAGPVSAFNVMSYANGTRNNIFDACELTILPAHRGISTTADFQARRHPDSDPANLTQFVISGGTPTDTGGSAAHVELDIEFQERK